MMTPRLWPLDDHGLIQIPRRFYWLLLLLLRPYLCWIMVLTLPAQNKDMLRVFYPEQEDFLLSCLIALPLLFLFAALTQRKPKGSRHWRIIWKQGRVWLLLTAFIDLFLTMRALPEQVMLDAPWKVLTPIALLVAIIWLCKSQTLRKVFAEWPEQA